MVATTLIAEIQGLRNEIAELRTTSAANSNNTVQITINNNIQINNFGTESYEHITDEFIKVCMLDRVPGVKNLIEKIHFSEDAPMNRNVRLKSLKNSLLEVKKDDKWVTKDTNEALETMIKKGCSILNQSYYADEQLMERDLTELDNKVQQFLTEILVRDNNNYYALRKRILALVIEYSVP
jgi:hypothetical protein